MSDDPVPVTPTINPSTGGVMIDRTSKYQRRTVAEMQEQMLREKAALEEQEKARIALDIQRALTAAASVPPAPVTRQQAASQIRAQIRDFLTADVTVGRGKRRRTAQRIQLLAENLFKIAIDPRSPFAVQASNALLDRGYGKPVAGDIDDPDATKKGGLTVIYVDRNKIDSSIPVISAEEVTQKRLSAPEFADAQYEEEEPPRGR